MSCCRASRTRFVTMKHNLIPVLEEMRLPGESLLDTARRVLTHNALQQELGCQADAAFLLHISDKMMNDWAKDFGLRPRDHVLRVVASHGRVS